jgi:hypothetical protein
MTSEMNLMQRCVDDQIAPASLTLSEAFYVDIGGILCTVYVLQKTGPAPEFTMRELMTEREKRSMKSRKKQRLQNPQQSVHPAIESNDSTAQTDS